ncbi:MAG: ATP-dependent DNA helicase RecG [Treponema sp.]|jgi:ATP-dependent DNA helicase RecG|nr:ATP-dependent DNA helicase RecG [Treponema sp.]
MFLRSCRIPVKSIINKNENIIPKLARLGIFSVSDLLSFYPRDWEDRGNMVPLKNFKDNCVCTLVTVLSREFMGYGPTRAMKVFVEDDTSQAVLNCFNLSKRPWLEKTLVTGSRHFVFGNFSVKKGALQSSSFKTSVETKADKFNKIFPVYSLTSGLKQINIQHLTSELLKRYAKEIEDELPLFITQKRNLLSKREAIKEIHFPSSLSSLERAKETLVYEELFYLEVMVIRRSLERKRINKGAVSTGGEKEFTPLQRRLLDRLPFKLTDGQRGAVEEINGDMSSNAGMARLLQGDVGSGKTLVSFLAALKTQNGAEKGQAVIMAPTELLARQHAENAARLLEPLGINIAFLTGNIKAQGRRELLKNLASGMIDIAVGTHALFSRDVEYNNLKLIVIDEQHRFGVTQRALIMSKGKNPGLLMMSATPIPRTLSLTVFGDMDVSVIKDMPPGRKIIKTHLAKESNEKKVYDFVNKELQKGRQAYFVYPLIEGADGIKDAVSMADRLSADIFPGFKTALIHSKLPEDDKKKTMDDFRRGEIKILAATSVVEVGVDVPNATCMVIEHAERFGLSALHQLRGRVGRGQEQSYCFLVYSDDLTDEGKMRLKVMLENNDGFIIAEEDLRLRGPGQIMGKEQSGYLVLGISNPIRDMDILVKAREDALSILENDPDLLLENNRVIARVLNEAPPFNETAL